MTGAPCATLKSEHKDLAVSWYPVDNYHSLVAQHVSSFKSIDNLSHLFLKIHLDTPQHSS